MYVCIHICTYPPTYLHTYIQEVAYYVYMYPHLYIPTYLHTYIHTYIHTGGSLLCQSTLGRSPLENADGLGLSSQGMYLPTYLLTVADSNRLDVLYHPSYLPTYLHTYIQNYQRPAPLDQELVARGPPVFDAYIPTYLPTYIQ